MSALASAVRGRNREAVSATLPNHIAPTLSNLDLRIITHVPEGSNWKSIPHDVPSERLKQIRESFAAGEGSRSTYYGRLRRTAPSYTINTYFTRPGNGCHIHYSQNRVLSYREAARLQSFPDSFVFLGTRTAVAKQIGNAVPPLLALQIASQLGEPGVFVDLFAGAGGLSLGFTWAGWEPLVANDIERAFLDTYAANVDDRVIPGDLGQARVFGELVNRVRADRDPDRPLWVVGGPPCQGFSTAGNRRTTEDLRNALFRSYARFLLEVQPDGFVFENVMGLLNMEKGRVLAEILSELGRYAPQVQTWVLRAEEHGVPQRRHRVFLLGSKTSRTYSPPPRLTALEPADTFDGRLAPAITVADAIEDLPALEAGEDGSRLAYSSPPRSDYQRLMRGEIRPGEFLGRLRQDGATE